MQLSMLTREAELATYGSSRVTVKLLDQAAEHLNSYERLTRYTGTDARMAELSGAALTKARSAVGTAVTDNAAALSLHEHVPAGRITSGYANAFSGALKTSVSLEQITNLLMKPTLSRDDALAARTMISHASGEIADHWRATAGGGHDHAAAAQALMHDVVTSEARAVDPDGINSAKAYGAATSDAARQHWNDLGMPEYAHGTKFRDWMSAAASDAPRRGYAAEPNVTGIVERPQHAVYIGKVAAARQELGAA